MNSPARIRVLTFKEGLLSRLAHDLELELGRFELELDAGAVEGRLQLGSLRVVGAVQKGRVVHGVLGDADRTKIERSMHEEVLATARHPTATLSGRLQAGPGTRVRLAGTLELGGRSAPLEGELEQGPEQITGRFELAPSRWGIAPFRALGGALKIQDRVVVEVQLPTDVPGFDAATPLASVARWVHQS